MFSVTTSRGEYNVLFNQELNKKLQIHIPEDSFVIIDSYIYKNYPLFSEILPKDKIYILDAKEDTKTLKTCEEIISLLTTSGFKRNHKLVAIGGGITQDVTSFAASILYRGVQWVFFPTTLLAQADSCIGSKTSINFSGTKNLLGSYHAPSKVICCKEFLNTLPVRDIKSGIGEMLHYYLIENSSLVNNLVDEYEDILSSPSDMLTKHIEESLRIKRIMVQKDEFDQKERRVFNYGHTFGHAIESITEHKISHGLAVTLGMDLANFISLRLGNITREEFLLLRSFLQKNLIDYKIPSEKLNEYFSLLMKDKKNVDNSLVCVIPYGIGDIRLHKFDHLEPVKSFIKEYMDYKNDIGKK
jgi:3-dehydroquinate synthase